MPGTSTGLVMEMFPFRAPLMSNIFKKTWHRFKDFVFVAFPIVLVGSLLLGALYETGYLWKLAAPLSPVVEGWLGLPAVLRKELALQLLVTLAVVMYGGGAKNLLLFMTPTQLFVYALVNTIYIPCVATIAVLGRELGWKRAFGIMAFTITLSILIGGIAFRVIGYYHLL
jgi:ferrous iron transport protein B